MHALILLRHSAVRDKDVLMAQASTRSWMSCPGAPVWLPSAPVPTPPHRVASAPTGRRKAAARTRAGSGGTRAKAPCVKFPGDTRMQEKMQRKSTLKMDDLGNCEDCHDKEGFCSVFGHLLVSGLFSFFSSRSSCGRKRTEEDGLALTTGLRD